MPEQPHEQPIILAAQGKGATTMHLMTELLQQVKRLYFFAFIGVVCAGSAFAEAQTCAPSKSASKLSTGATCMSTPVIRWTLSPLELPQHPRMPTATPRANP